MTRPMPEPPTCVADGFPHERTAPHACLIHARSYHANSKRLTDEECDKEARAACALWLHTTSPDLLKMDDVWERFATRPHALEVQE